MSLVATVASDGDLSVSQTQATLKKIHIPSKPEVTKNSSSRLRTTFASSWASISTKVL